MNYRGYTLIELVVVMSIMAVLIALGIGGLVSLRASSQVDAVAEDIVASIRTAQNNSMTIRDGGCEDHGGGTTKVWTVNFWMEDENNNGLDTIRTSYYCGESDGSVVTDLWNRQGYQNITTPYRNVTIRVVGQDGTIKAWGVSSQVSFTTPLGKGYVFESLPNIDWGPSGNPEQDWIPCIEYTGECSSSITTSPIRWRVSKGNYSRDVVIQPNGDVYEE